MAYGTPADPVAGTVITVAYAVTNLLDPIRWLRQMTGNSDPPGSNYWLRSTSTTGVTWASRDTEVMAALGYTPVNKAGDTMTGSLTFSTNTSGIVLSGSGQLFDVSGLGTLFRPHNDAFGLQQQNSTGMMTVTPSGALFPQPLQALTLAATVATGTPPLTVASTTVVPNLNADLLDGMHAADIISTAASGGVPAGVIAMWLTSMTPPSGWVIETNLANVFPGGVNGSGTGLFGALNSTGGATQHFHDQSQHVHSGPSHAHSLNNHTHGFSGTTASSGSTDGLGNNGGTSVNTTSHTHGFGGTTGGNTGDTGGAGSGNTGPAGDFTGGASGAGSNTTALNTATLPPFRAVLFIRKS